MLIIRHLRKNIYCSCGFATRYRPKIDKSKFSKNPGIQNQLQLFMQDNPDVEKIKAEDVNPEELEGDFMKAADIIDDYDRALSKSMEKHEFKSIERKYFKSSPAPNMLKWTEKEQIRYLHNENPDHWTLENLAASFPATPGVIKKILKSIWKPSSADDVTKHDERVARNWNDFVQGHLKIDRPEVKEHLEKFTSRQSSIPSIVGTDLKQLIDNPVPKPKTSEFSSIISSYKQEIKATERTLLPASVDLTVEKEKSERLRKNQNIDTTQYSLELFKEKVKEEIDTSKNVSEEDMLLLSEKKRNLVSNYYVPSSEKFDCDAVVASQGKLGQIAHFNEEQYPQKIFIPKDKRKPGALYKVNDCYYTSDGLFLYRVPGMTHAF